MSSYAISIELIVDFLNITGSGDFVEEFIDYALNSISATATAYSTMTTKYTYNKEEYNVKSDFTVELYDMIDYGRNNAGDSGNDNYKAYKDIIFGRKYLERDFERVTGLSNFEDINYDGIEYENGQSYSVGALHGYLKADYNPPTGFNLQNIDVKEIIIKEEKENKWVIVPSSANTWYGSMIYTAPTIEEAYTISDGYSEQAITQEEFDEFNYDDLTNYQEVEEEEKKRVYLSDTLNSQSPTEGAEIIPEGTDLYDNLLTVYPGINNQSNFWNWTVKGLADIAMKDNNGYDSDLGGGAGCDYIYSEYTKNNTKDYIEQTKTKKEIINTSNVTRSYDENIDEGLKNFLELLKNETGEIPTSIGSEGGFKQDGKVVEYRDIYDGLTPVGDLLLDNGALMLFELLESTESTQSLVNLFKYLAYLYSEVDYGVQVEDLIYIFDLRNVTQGVIYGSSVEERVWYTLRDLGYSEIAVAGVMGNIYGESGFRPDAIESNGEGYGLCQWSYGRKEQLLRYADIKGKEWTDTDTQIEFLVGEITGQGVAVPPANAQMNSSYRGYTKADWEDATTVEDATTAFCYVFERPGIPHLQNRIEMGENYYNTYQGREIAVIGNFTGTEGEKICAAAEEIRNYCNSNGYSYDVTVPSYTDGVRALWNKKGVCCASYVAWTLVESGIVSEEYINTLSFRGATPLGDGLKKIFPVVTAEEMQKGDLIFWPGHHTQIYAGDNYWYNAGTSPIKYSQYDAIDWFRRNYGWSSYYILRPVQQ